MLQALLARAGLPAQAVDAVVLGNALGAGGNPARMLALAAGLPERCAAHSVAVDGMGLLNGAGDAMGQRVVCGRLQQVRVACGIGGERGAVIGDGQLVRGSCCCHARGGEAR